MTDTRRAPRAIELVAALVGIGALAASALVAVVHLTDGFHVDHVAGAWMGLADAASDGVLYPDLHEHGFFGGTRYGPLGIALDAGALWISGSHITSGKVISLLVVAALLGVVFLLARRLGCSRPLALATCGAVVANFTTVFAGTTIYGDALAVLLQLGAITVVARRTDARSASAAGVLAALAVTAKSSGLWGGAAVAVWLLLRDRRSARIFAVTAIATGVAVFGAAQVLSGGRMIENVLGLGGSGFSGVGDLVWSTPRKAFDAARARAIALLVLSPFAVIGCVIAARRRTLEVVHVALAFAALVTLVVLSDVGTDFNHLLDLAVLVPIVVAALVQPHARSALHAAIAGLLVVATLASVYDQRHDVRDAMTIATDRRTPAALEMPALAGVLQEPYFAEDPSLATARGDRPVVLDPFMLLRVLDEDPKLVPPLVRRFERHEFRMVVLFNDLDLSDPWWSDTHLGLDVARAIDRNYRHLKSVRGPVFRYRLFVPK
jgi:hypothetical protein